MVRGPWCQGCGTKLGKKHRRTKNPWCIVCSKESDPNTSFCYNYIVPQLPLSGANPGAPGALGALGITCVGCSHTSPPGASMKVHLRGPMCSECHMTIIMGPQREWLSTDYGYYDLYDFIGNRLCDISGCGVYGPFLNNEFNGFFCNMHCKQMRQLRNIIKSNPDTETEYQARVHEIFIRKKECVNHVAYAKNLRMWLDNKVHIDFAIDSMFSTTAENRYSDQCMGPSHSMFSGPY